ncbi:hypothetical protein [Stenotrophomonas sp. MMGLT7]|uniref:hypothetical protein n=1 Tax=Stenotrophomonas sp. MMGLT7 TaxID=2901227 RepID=UPI001E39B1A8|nr:hypothetical protein [Stenotrophomonas sp. MMGLT7]MCD7098114.1 hypothetical protein [Stenotrophomonas sp. MMGLT7]
MPTTSLLRNVLSAATVFAVSWGGAIFYWRSSGAAPNGWDLLTWLGIVPAGLLGGGWMLSSGWRRLAQAGADRLQRQDGQAPPPAPAAAETAAAAPGPQAGLTLVRAAAVNLACGSDAGQLSSQHTELARPGLHPKLRDRDGLPVFAAYVPDLDVDAARDWVQDRQGASAFGEAPLRALALLQPVAEELLLQALAELPAPRELPGEVVAGLRRQQESIAGGHLDVALLLPADWNEQMQRTAAAIVSDWAAELGLAAAQLRVEAVPARSSGDAWRLLQRLTRREPEGEHWQLLLAAGSLVDAAWIERLQMRGALADHRHPEGTLPGEGAAGVLLRQVRGGADADGVVLHPPRLAALETVPASERARVRQSAELLQAAMQAAGVEAGQVDWLVSDADQRADRAVEASSAAVAACPELDGYRQCFACGALAGTVVPVVAVATLALAATRAGASDRAVLVLGVDEPDLRVAAVVATASLPAGGASPDSAPDGTVPAGGAQNIPT